MTSFTTARGLKSMTSLKRSMPLLRSNILTVLRTSRVGSINISLKTASAGKWWMNKSWRISP